MSTKSPKFADKRGFLTSYAHRCGYLDIAHIGDDRNAITMGAEGAVYFVKVAPAKDRCQVWDCFDATSQGRKDARKRFMQLIREHKATREFNKP